LGSISVDQNIILWRNNGLKEDGYLALE